LVTIYIYTLYLHDALPIYEYIFEGNDFKNDENFSKLKELNLDYIIGIHFPYIIPTEVLKIPKTGFLNLHPAYLPYNKGWNTPSRSEEHTSELQSRENLVCR